MTEENEIKVILVGETGTGKTSLINTFIGLKFDEKVESTSSASFVTHKMQIEGKTYAINLWDTIGQEKLKAQTKIFFKNSKIVILVYDITNKKSFTELENWHKQVKESLGDNIVLGVLGNKKDLFLQEDVKEEEAEEYAKSIGAKWGLTSAKTERQSFVTYMEDLIKIYIEKAKIKEKDKQIEETEKKGSIKLNSENIEPKKKKKCC